MKTGPSPKLSPFRACSFDWLLVQFQLLDFGAALQPGATALTVGATLYRAYMPQSSRALLSCICVRRLRPFPLLTAGPSINVILSDPPTVTNSPSHVGVGDARMRHATRKSEREAPDDISTFGIATLAIRMLSENQLLHASAAVRALLALLAGLKWSTIGAQNARLYNKRNLVLGVLLYDGLGGLHLGWYLDFQREDCGLQVTASTVSLP
ncbi:hypothetical protein C8R45DRAFT_922923 [Mycena sanguinolenta]|nr:hypothetical protein C8R45DRAFT_922923 [Mycena sanguinolenta]